MTVKETILFANPLSLMTRLLTSSNHYLAWPARSVAWPLLLKINDYSIIIIIMIIIIMYSILIWGKTSISGKSVLYISGNIIIIHTQKF